MTGDSHQVVRELADGTVRRRLTAVLREALRRSGRCQVYLELFSGTARFARALRRESQHEVIEFDISRGEEFDLTRRAVCRLVRGWITSGRVKGVWCAFPCSTWSTARWPPLRSLACIHGIPEMLRDPRTAALIDVGNRTLRAAVSVANLCCGVGVPMILENPGYARSWHEPSMARLGARQQVRDVLVDYCRFGTPWRKRTRLRGINVTELETLQLQCSGKQGLCYTGKPHQRLNGSDPKTHQLWTRLAEPYPPRFCKKAASVLHRSSEHRMLNNLFRLGI